MPRTITTYSLSELKELHPDSYQRVIKRESERIRRHGCSWSDEIGDSLEAVRKVFEDGRRDYMPDYVYDDEMGENRWFTIADAWKRIGPKYTEAEYLPNEHHKDGRRHFPGICGFTGVCYDDDILESVLHDLEDGCSLSEALRNAEIEADRIAERDLDDEASESSIVEFFDEERQFTDDGTEV